MKTNHLPALRVTSITASLLLAAAGVADVVRDGSLGPGAEVQPTGPNFVIPETHGRFADGSESNLFHSFAEFDLTANQSATFTGPAAVANILARITDNNASSIDGLVASAIDGADLYLINPQGFMFGPNARLDVRGAFYATTADEVRLGSDGLFAVTVPSTSLLTVSPPSAFGFLGTGPVAPIRIDRSLLVVPDGEAIGIIGGNIDIIGTNHPEATGRAAGDTLYAPGGTIALAAVAGPGMVTLSDTQGIDTSGVDTFADIVLDGTPAIDPMTDEGGNLILDAAGDPGGRVVIRGGQLTMARGAAISGATLGATNHPGTAADILLTGDMVMAPGTEIGVSTTNLGDAGDVRIRANRLTMTGDPTSPAFGGFGRNANIGARTFGAAQGAPSGNGGSVLIDVGEFVMNDQTFIQTTTFSNGTGGNIEINANRITMTSDQSFAFISSSAAGSGDAGSVLITTDDLIVQKGRNGGGFTGIAVQVRSDAEGNPNGGVLDINASGSVRLLDGAQLNGAIFFGAGNGADINIAATTLEVGGTTLAPDGSISIDPTFFPSGIFSTASDFNTFGGTPANSGDINITVTDLIVRDGGLIRNAADFPSAANAGNTTINAETILLSNSGAIANDSFGFGNGATIDITASSLDIRGPSVNPTQLGTGVFAQGGTGAQSSSQINLDVGQLTITDGGAIRTTTFGMAPGGPVTIRADDIRIAGFDDAPAIGDFVSGVENTPSQIISGSLIFQDFVQFSGGDGGRVTIDTNSLTIDDRATIVARTETTGTGGSIDITANRLEVLGQATIDVNSTADGDAGIIQIATTNARLTGGQLTAAAATAAGGNIELSAQQSLLLEGATVSAAVAGGGGDGGNVTLTALDAIVLRDASISADAVAGDGGRIQLTTNALISDPASTVTASSSLGVDGTVEVNSPETDVAGAIQIPEGGYGDAAGLMQDRCSAQSNAASGSASRSASRSASQFVVVDGDGLAQRPDALQAEPIDGRVTASVPAIAFRSPCASF